jgi:hypothetical protein
MTFRWSDETMTEAEKGLATLARGTRFLGWTVPLWENFGMTHFLRASPKWYDADDATILQLLVTRSTVVR